MLVTNPMIPVPNFNDETWHNPVTNKTIRLSAWIKKCLVELQTIDLTLEANTATEALMQFIAFELRDQGFILNQEEATSPIQSINRYRPFQKTLPGFFDAPVLWPHQVLNHNRIIMMTVGDRSDTFDSLRAISSESNPLMKPFIQRLGLADLGHLHTYGLNPKESINKTIKTQEMIKFTHHQRVPKESLIDQSQGAPTEKIDSFNPVYITLVDSLHPVIEMIHQNPQKIIVFDDTPRFASDKNTTLERLLPPTEYTFFNHLISARKESFCPPICFIGPQLLHTKALSMGICDETFIDSKNQEALDEWPKLNDLEENVSLVKTMLIINDSTLQKDDHLKSTINVIRKFKQKNFEFQIIIWGVGKQSLTSNFVNALGQLLISTNTDERTLTKNHYQLEAL